MHTKTNTKNDVQTFLLGNFVYSVIARSWKVNLKWFYVENQLEASGK